MKNNNKYKNNTFFNIYVYVFAMNEIMVWVVFVHGVDGVNVNVIFYGDNYVSLHALVLFFSRMNEANQ